VPVEDSGPNVVFCVVCLDEGCEWCPAVDACEEARAAEPPPERPAA
jgi:hypothetical protein